MLAIQALAYRYPGSAEAALDDVSLQAARGEVLGLLGPNGAGKTTLISHLAGLREVQQGTVTIDGEPLAAVRAHTPTRIAVAPQEYAFYPMLTVQQNLACFASAARIARSKRVERIGLCAATAQLENVLGTRADQLSGGLKRRLNLAIALLPEPELIVFDEPTVGVDPQTRAFVLDAIRALAEAGAAVIYTSHYMEEIEAIADRVIILDHGRVLRDGYLDDLLAEGAKVLTITADAIEPAALREVLGFFGPLDPAGPAPHTVRLRLDRTHRLGEVLAALEATGAQVQHAEFGRHDLEQLFMALTRRPLRD